MKAMVMISTGLLTVGCATGAPYDTERVDNEYRRENGRIEAAEQFQRLTRACRLAGGIVRMERQTSGRFPPNTLEMRGATCDRHPDAAQIW